MRKKIFVALVTPFTKENNVDFVGLKRIISRLMSEGVDGFVVCGTTAETPTLSNKEKIEILEFVLNETKQQVEVWFGCGSNNTQDTVRAVQKAQMYPIQGVLLVVPYYNKPSQEGIYQHFSKIAMNCKTNIMIYNIPSRTNVQIETNTLKKLIIKHKNIVALKQASKDFELVKIIKKEYPKFIIYSGEDSMLDESIDVGMDGLISVMAHINLPKIKKFIKYNMKDNKLRKELVHEANLIFSEPSPACIKYCLFCKNEIENRLRLPMVTVQNEELKNELEDII